MTDSSDSSNSVSDHSQPPLYKLFSHHCSWNPAGWLFGWELLPEAGSVGVARQLVQVYIEPLFLPEKVFCIVALVSEAVTNAIKAADKKTTTIVMTLHLHSSHPRLILDVKDNNGTRGCWIPKRPRNLSRNLNRLFDYHETHGNGLGLGLYLMEHFTKVVGGSLKISQEGIWNHIHVHIPIGKLINPYCPQPECWRSNKRNPKIVS